MSDALENDVYATLSEQERQAILLNDDGSEPEESRDEPVETEPEQDVTETDPEPDSTDAESEPATEQADELEESVETPEVIREEVFAPQFQAEAVENFKETIAQLDTAFDTQAAELAAKYENGEMTFSDYRREERLLARAYEDQRQELVKANLKAEIAYEHSRQSASQKWQLEQDLFYSDKPTNAEYKSDPILRGALSAQLEQLYADEKNAGKPGIWFLREAGRALDEKFNRATTPIKQNVTKLKEAEDVLRKRKANHPDIPKTLASVPTAEENAVDNGNEFDWLDKLSGLAYEKAYSKLSEAERDRYLAA